MKVRCADGKTRTFIAAQKGDGTAWWNNKDREASCAECGEKFGISNANILRPKFVKHVCVNIVKQEDSNPTT
jgi:hypothetical protein